MIKSTCTACGITLELTIHGGHIDEEEPFTAEDLKTLPKCCLLCGEWLHAKEEESDEVEPGSDWTTAEALTSEYGRLLIGRKVVLKPCHEYPGGEAVVANLWPDSDSVCTVTCDGEEVAVSGWEELRLLPGSVQPEAGGMTTRTRALVLGADRLRLVD